MADKKTMAKFIAETAAAFVLPILMSASTWLFAAAWLIPARQLIGMLKHRQTNMLGVLAIIYSFFGMFWLMVSGTDEGMMFQASRIMLITTYYSAVFIACFVDGGH